MNFLHPPKHEIFLSSHQNHLVLHGFFTGHAGHAGLSLRREMVSNLKEHNARVNDVKCLGEPGILEGFSKNDGPGDFQVGIFAEYSGIISWTRNVFAKKDADFYWSWDIFQWWSMFFSRIFLGKIITTSAEVTTNGFLVRESPPQNALNSGLGIVVLCRDICTYLFLSMTIIG